MEVFVPPYYIPPDQPYLEMYVECIHEGKQKKGIVVDCVPFLKYEIETEECAKKPGTNNKKRVTVDHFNIVHQGKFDYGSPPLIDTDEEAVYVTKRGRKPEIGTVKRVFDHSYYTVEFKNDHRRSATFTREKLYEISYKDYFELCRPSAEDAEGPSTPDEVESVDEDFIPGEARESSETANSSDSDEEHMSENELNETF